MTPHKLALVAQGAGRIQSRYVSQVGFEVGGRLISRDVDVGAIVKKGQKLAELSAVDYQNKVTAAEADLAAAKAALAQAAAQEERFRILLAKGFATHSHYDDALKSLQSAQAAVQATEANLRIAQNQLGYTQLARARRRRRDGDRRRPGPGRGRRARWSSRSPAMTRARRSSPSPARHVARAKLGMAVNVSLQGRPDIAVTGTIREISPEADSTTGTYQVKVALPSPPPEMRLGAVVVGRVESEGPGGHDAYPRPRCCSPETSRRSG